ncbi:hypothetical protein ES705_30579 [subsurface metagenome]
MSMLGLSLVLNMKTLNRIKAPPIRIDNVTCSPKNMKAKGYTKTKDSCVNG